MKIAQITPICKSRDIENVADYKAISVLQCFLKKSLSSS